MATSSSKARGTSKRAKKPTAGANGIASRAAAAKRTRSAATNHAIATELAPAVAIALLDKTEQLPGAASPSLECLAAGASPSTTDGKIRVQLMFENGAVLPVETSTAAGAALSRGLASELTKE